MTPVRPRPLARAPAEGPQEGKAMTTTHRVWRLNADIDTDVLAPGHAMKHGIEIIAKHCLESVRPEFAGEVKPGDVIVAGPNFGIGSSREQAAAVLVHLGVAAVIAPSYSGLYFRNAFNVGLLLLTCADIESIKDGDRIALDALSCEPVPDFLMAMVKAGGLLPLLRQRLGAKKEQADARH